MVTSLALFCALVYCLVAFFQLALVLGVPWGEYAWGGQHSGRLPTKFRIASFIGFFLLLSFAAIHFKIAGWVELPSVLPSVKNLQYVITAYAALGTLMNAISRSKKERYLWTPINMILLVLNWILLKSL